MNRGSNSIFNFITVIFLVLSLLAFLIILGMIARVVPVPVGMRPITATIPETRVVPSPTITDTPTDTPTPSRTLTPTRTRTPTATASPTETATETPTNTETPTRTPIPSRTPLPSATSVPTREPSATRTPSRTRSPRPTATPRPPTAVPVTFPFRVQEGTPQLTSNLDATTGCSFQGIGGQVFGLKNEPLTGIQVHVSSTAGFNQPSVSGSNPTFGQAGWMVQVGSAPNNQTYTVEVQDQQGTPISPKVQITFPGSCQQNLALVNFVQTRPF